MMSLFRNSVFCAAALLASACTGNLTQVVDGTQKASNRANEEVVKLTDKLRQITTYRPKPTQRKPVPPSYCYHVMQDIVCYRDPRPGGEGRLVAYQGTVTEGEEEVAEAMPVMQVETRVPAPAMPARLESITPQLPAPAAAQDSEQKARTEKSMARFSEVKPVFVGQPPEVKPVE